MQSPSVVLGSRIPARAPFVLGAGAGVLSFGILAALWWLFTWPNEGPGLFDYRSATIGYGLLVPVLVALLAGALRRLAKGGESPDRRIFFGAATAGACFAIAIQVAWLLDDSPALNWSFPHAHHFNGAGIWNAVALIGLFAAAAGLVSVVGIRIARLRKAGEDLRSFVSMDQLALFVGTAVALVGLVVLDNGRASDTQAGMATLVGVVAAGVLIVGLLGAAFRAQLRVYVPALLWGLCGAVGCVALSQHGIDAPVRVVVGILVVAVLVGAAITQPFSTPRPFRPGAIIAASLVLAGAGAQAVHLAPEHGAAAGGVVVLGAALATVVGSIGAPLDLAVVLRAFAALFCLATLAWSAWVEVKNDPGEARNAYDAITVLFEILVLILIRDRFKDLVGGELAQAERERRRAKQPIAKTRGESPQVLGYAAWIQFVGFAVPAVVVALVFVAAAAPLLGSNDVAAGSTPPIGEIAVAGILAVLLSVAAAVVAHRQKSPTRKPKSVDHVLPVPGPSAVLLIIAAVGTGGVFLAHVDGHLRLEGLALVLGLFYGALCLEDLVASPALIQLLKPGVRGWAVAVAAGTAQAAILFWLLTHGLWHEGAPATVGSMVATTLVALFLGYAVDALAGLSLARSMPGDPLTPEPPEINVVGIGLLYLGLALLATVIPTFVIGRILATGDLTDSGTIVLGSVFIVPSCVAAYFWILKENFEHVARERTRAEPPAAIKALASGDMRMARSYDETRLTRQQVHVWWQFGLSLALFVIGFGYAMYVSI